MNSPSPARDLNTSLLKTPVAPTGMRLVDFPLKLPKNLEQEIYVGRPVWAYAPHTGCWEAGVIACTDLLTDRCLFEVDCDRLVGSDRSFLSGRGITCHRSFYRVDWFFRDELSDTPPPAHPRMTARHLLDDCAVGVSGRAPCSRGSSPMLGIIRGINSRQQTFELMRCQDFHQVATKEIRPIPPRWTLPFSQTGVAVLTERKVIIGQQTVSLEDLITCPSYGGLEAAFRVRGIDLQSKTIVASGSSLLQVGAVVAIPFEAVSRPGNLMIISNNSTNPFTSRFPILVEEQKDLMVTFNFEGTKIIGHTSISNGTSTLPAFLEVLIWKRDVPTLSRAATIGKDDSLYRFQLKVQDIVAISL